MHLKLTLAALAAGFAGLGIAHAADPQSASPPATPPSQSGIKVYIDPATGQWSERPVTPQQKQEAASVVSGDPSKIRTVQHDDGSVEYQMNGQFMESMVASRGADGKLHVVCSEHGIEHAHAPVVAPVAGGSDER